MVQEQGQGISQKKKHQKVNKHKKNFTLVIIESKLNINSILVLVNKLANYKNYKTQ